MKTIFGRGLDKPGEMENRFGELLEHHDVRARAGVYSSDQVLGHLCDPIR